jgi:acyl-coenzyme A thioesterase PaaI-like protein
LRVSKGPTRREIIEQFIPNSPHAAQLGIRLVSLGTDEAVLVLPYKPELAAAWATDEVPENLAGSTVSLSVNFSAAANGADLRAGARVAKRGGRLSFCEVTVTDPEGAVVAHGIATYRFG